MTVTVPGGSPPSRPYPTPYADVVEQAPVPVRRSRWSRLWLGPAEDPRWARPALVVLLLATGLLYVWNLGASGWANSFYSAAVQAGSTSWKAFFFGSFDSSSFITVDKPPASLWVMDLSARVFGLNAWSVLVPQALEGVAAVGLLYATVRRVASPAAGLLAGVVLACTPVATLMFRFNNPDALLVLLLVGAAYATTRALERGRTWWLLLAAGLVGTGFITKMLQAFILVPVLAVVYLVAAPGPVRRRLLQLVAAGAALVVASGWWVAVVSLVPMADRPYIGGSQTNSVLDLALGYNGLGRLNGNESGSVVGGGGPGGAGSWGATGWLRLFGADIGGQVAWLLPAALVLMVALLWLWRRVPRTDARRAAVLLWGGWLLLTGAVFSYAQGIIHPYYTVALAPAIGALVGIGGVTLWRLREVAWARFVLAGTVAITTFWTYALLERSPDWYPGLRTLVVVAGVLATAGLVAGPLLRGRATAAVAGTALAASLVAPVAYSLQTVSTPHTGALPTAGPAVAATRGGGPGGPAGFGPRRGFQGQGQSQGQRQGGFGPRGQGFGGQGFGGQGFGGQGFGGAGGGGALGGLLDAGTPSQALVALLRNDASSYDWVAAAVGANSAAGVQLATREPVMAIGGFNGTDPTPTLAQFQQLVAAGRVHYFLAGGRGGGGFGGGGSGPAGEITRWVEQTFTPQTVGGTTVYDLTATAANNGGTVRTT